VQPNGGNPTVLSFLLRQTGAEGGCKPKTSGENCLFKSVWSPAGKLGDTHSNIPDTGTINQRYRSVSQT